MNNDRETIVTLEAAAPAARFRDNPPHNYCNYTSSCLSWRRSFDNDCDDEQRFGKVTMKRAAIFFQERAIAHKRRNILLNDNTQRTVQAGVDGGKAAKVVDNQSRKKVEIARSDRLAAAPDGEKFESTHDGL